MAQYGSHSVSVFRLAAITNLALLDSFLEEVKKSVKREKTIILVDLSEVPYLNGIVLGCLINAYFQASALNGNLHLCCISKQTQDLIQLKGLEKLFHFFETCSDFEQFVMKQGMEQLAWPDHH